MPVILITGAAGQVGAMLRPRLAAPGRILRLADIAPLAAGPGEEAVTASVTDLAAMTAACDGADAVIHLGGIPLEADWDRILDVNIHGTYTTFDYGGLRLSAQEIGPGETLQLSVDVTNTGSRAGQEVAQVYVRDVEARLRCCRPDERWAR